MGGHGDADLKIVADRKHPETTGSQPAKERGEELTRALWPKQTLNGQAGNCLSENPHCSEPLTRAILSVGSTGGIGSETAPVHHPARGRGDCVDAPRTCSTVRASAAYRRPYFGCHGGRSGRAGAYVGLSAGPTAIGLDRWPQHSDRLSLGRGR